MKLLWFYSRSQIEKQRYIPKRESKSPRKRVTPDEILVSEHIEENLNPVILILCKVKLVQWKKEYLCWMRKVQRDKLKRPKILRWSRLYLSHTAAEYNDDTPTRRLKVNELSSILAKPNSKQDFYKYEVINEAKNLGDDDVEVSHAICSGDERDKEQELIINELRCQLSEQADEKKGLIDEHELAVKWFKAQIENLKREHNTSLAILRTECETILVKEMRNREDLRRLKSKTKELELKIAVASRKIDKLDREAAAIETKEKKRTL